MPLRNRVTPLGELVSHPARGLVYGNRGCLHDADGAIVRAYGVRRWIACRLEFRGRRRSPLLRPGRYTELFFLDDATALAAGHRPCAECRRGDYRRFLAAWRELHPQDGGADALDARLHAERWDAASGRRRLVRRRLADLPDGTFVLLADNPALVRSGELLRWAPEGYADAETTPAKTVEVVTPRSVVELLRAGWRPRDAPFVHPSAERAADSDMSESVTSRGQTPGHDD